MTRTSSLCVLLAGLLAAATAIADEPVVARPASFDCPGLFEAGLYLDAVSCFESLEDQGNVNGHLLYDLGNARYRAGQMGEAIVAWRRARLFLPRDGDVKANLDAARDQTKDDLEPPGQRAGLARPLLAPFDALAATELLLVGSVAWALLFLVLSIRLRRPFAGWLALACTLAVLTIAGLGGSMARSYSVSRHPVAVVTLDEVTLRSGRDVLSTDLARLHEGAEATVVEQRDDWVQVTLSTGLRGWLPAGAVGLVRHLDR
jgi:hypothetical protein